MGACGEVEKMSKKTDGLSFKQVLVETNVMRGGKLKTGQTYAYNTKVHTICTHGCAEGIEGLDGVNTSGLPSLAAVAETTKEA